MSKPKSLAIRAKNIIFPIILGFLVLTFIVPPIYNNVFDKATPFIGPLPFNLFWINLALGIFCSVLLILYLVEVRLDDL